MLHHCNHAPLWYKVFSKSLWVCNFRGLVVTIIYHYAIGCFLGFCVSMILEDWYVVITYHYGIRCFLCLWVSDFRGLICRSIWSWGSCVHKYFIHNTESTRILQRVIKRPARHSVHVKQQFPYINILAIILPAIWLEYIL